MPAPAVAAVVALIARSVVSAATKRALTTAVTSGKITPNMATRILTHKPISRAGNIKAIKDLMKPQGTTYHEPPPGVKPRTSVPEEEYPKGTFFVKSDGRIGYGKFNKDGRLIEVPMGKNILSRQGKPGKTYPPNAAEKNLQRKIEIAKLPKPKKVIPISKELWRLIKFPGEHQRGVERINPNLLTKKQLGKMNDKTEVVVEIRGGGIYRTTKGEMYRAELQERNIGATGSSKINKREAATRKELDQEFKPTSEGPLEETFVYNMRHPITGKKILDKNGKPVLIRITGDTPAGREKTLATWAEQLGIRNITKAGKPLTGKSDADKIFVPAKRNLKAPDGMDESKFIDIGKAKILWNKHVEKAAEEGFKATGGETFQYKSMPQGLPINMRPRAKDLSKPSERGSSSALDKSVEKRDAIIRKEIERGLPESILKEVDKDKGFTGRVQKLILEYANRPKLAIEAPRRLRPVSEGESLSILTKNLFQINKQLKTSANKSPAKIKSLEEEASRIQNSIRVLERKSKTLPAKDI